MVNDAIPYKPYLGDGAYLLYFIKMFFQSDRPRFQYDAEIDGVKMPEQNGEEHSIVTDALTHLQGKFSGKGCYFPYSTNNDGLIEIFFYPKVKPVSAVMKELERS